MPQALFAGDAKFPRSPLVKCIPGLKTRRARPMPAEKAPAKVPLAVREELGVDVDQEIVVELDADDTVPIAEVEVEVVDEDLEEDVTETAHDLDDEDDRAGPGNSDSSIGGFSA